MDYNSIKQLLSSVAGGEVSADDAAEKLRHINFEDIGCAHIDHHRSVRKGFPEVVFGMGKTAGQIISIMKSMAVQENVILVTRVDKTKADLVLAEISGAEYHEDAGMIVHRQNEITPTGTGNILIITAGTSDIPVAMEAYLTAKHMGNKVETIFDVGVAGIHRLFSHKEKIEAASVLIVAAGMEGALPSVVAGMVSAPVIALPTSVGYGTSFGGLTALFSMLNCCSSNIAVVNIDNGFGAGYMASSINRVNQDPITTP